MAGKYEMIAELEPFRIGTATVTQMAQYYRVCPRTFMKKIDPMIHKIPGIACRKDKNGKKSSGRYPNLSPREVKYIVDFMEIRDRDGY
jgi:hypothetical protein